MPETGRDFLQAEAERLLRELDNINTPHVRRSAIGERFYLISGIRPGVGLKLNGLPDIAWCHVPGGKITLKDQHNNDSGPLTLQSFYIAKYPISFTQFQAFLDAPDGFEGDKW